MEKWQWLIDIFTFIGMAVCVVIALIAIVWLTCFVVKLLVKTFGVKFGKSYDLMVEDINKKAEAKRQRNEMKRNASFDKKIEILNKKLENKQKIHELKMAKLDEKLSAKEDAAKIKYFGESKKLSEKEIAKKEEEIAQIADNVDGEVQTIDVVKPEEPAKKTSKSKNKKK